MTAFSVFITSLVFLLNRFVLSDGFLWDGSLQRRLRGQQLPVQETSDDEDKVHVVILSNRLKATAVSIGSVCRTSKNKIHFHVFSTDKQEFEGYFNKLPDCRDSELDLQTIDQATASLLELGFEPIWWQVGNNQVDAAVGDEREWGIQTPYTNDKHAHALNLLRFYLPYLPSLSGVDKFIFLDDDVLLQRDIEEMFNLDFQPGVAMLAGCQHWKWSENVAGNFKASWNMTVRETGYIGDLDEVCDKSKHQFHGCVRPGLERELASLSQIFNPESEFASRPLDRQAFNMGLNVFDSKTWKNLKLTHRFEQWVDASNKLRLFPQDTLAFGLGLAYLALGDAVQCYEPGPISHLVGMAFVSEEGFEAAGWPLKKISEDAYALHYNGADKPWDNVRSSSSSSTCAEGKQADFLEMWKKACEDVGICTCKSSGEVAESRRDLRISVSYEYTGKQKVTTWLNAPNEDFEVNADQFEGDFFCGVVNWEAKYRLAVCEGPSADPSSIKKIKAKDGAISCGEDQVLSGVSYKNRSFSGGTCISYKGYDTTGCYSTDNGVTELKCGKGEALAEVGTTADGEMTVKCCELTQSR